MKLTPMSLQVLDYVQENGGNVSVLELVESTGRSARSINATITDLSKKGLVFRNPVTVEGQEKPVTYVVLSEEGEAFTQPEDE